MTPKNPFQTPMKPWPALESCARSVHLTETGLDLFYFEAGNPENTTILMIHGLGDEADTWRHVIQPLAEDYHIIAPDLPGYGRSEKPARKYSPKFLMGSVFEMMDQLSIESAVLMGSSLGGILSQAMSLIQPERVRGLILVDGAFLQAVPMSDSGLKMMQTPLLGEYLYTRLRKDPEAAFDSLKIVYHDLYGLPAADRAFLFERVNRRVWSKGQRRAYFSTLRQLMPWVRSSQKGLAQRLADLKAPTLVLFGEHDALFPAANANAIVKAQPAATAVTLPGVNHLPHQEDPPLFLAHVKPWLDRHFPRA
jgi:pimeloyl-ACP methyl ester carboxylesterase